MRELSLFTGAGGGLLASRLLGWTTVAAVEIDSFAQKILKQRQKECALNSFPIYGDIKNFDGTSFRGAVDIITGGFPCQDISTAGSRGQHLGLSGTRSGLWSEYKRIIEEVQPTYVFAENSPAVRTNGLQQILSDLAELGYDAVWGMFAASDSGAPQERRRFFLLGCPASYRERFGKHTESETPHHRETTKETESARAVACADHTQQRNSCEYAEACSMQTARVVHSAPRFLSWPGPPHAEGVVDGMAPWLDRDRATGNGQVPRVVVTAWETLNALLRQ